jgi:hypothetical protein
MASNPFSADENTTTGGTNQPAHAAADHGGTLYRVVENVDAGVWATRLGGRPALRTGR